MNFETLRVSVDGSIGRLELNRPKCLNALSAGSLRELIDAARWFDARPEVQVVVVRGEGKVFCAGADLRDPPTAAAAPLGGRPWIERRDAAKLGGRMADAIEAMRAVTIAEIHGRAVGGGVVLALACDLRVMAEDASLMIPEVDLGIPLTWGAIPRLVREVGPARAKEWVLTCRAVTAAEAREAGLVNRVVPAGDLRAAAQELAQTIAEKPDVPVAITKEHVNAVARAMSAGSTALGDPEVLVATLFDPAGEEARLRYVTRRFGREREGP